MAMAPPPNPLNRKPWPMKWIVLAIVACIIPYTWLTLAYRKENPAHQPYQDNKDRAQVMRLLGSDFYRFDLTWEISSGPPPRPMTLAETESLEGGLPPLLNDLLIDQPRLPAVLSPVLAAPAAPSRLPYPITLSLPRHRHGEELPVATLYQRDSELVLVLDFTKSAADLWQRELTVNASVLVPAHTLKPGEYQVSLLGAEESKRWNLTVF